MTVYWIYDLQNWALFLLISSMFLGLSMLGLFISRPIVRWILGPSGHCNDLVSYFFAGIGVFYGLALGLIAVGTWENFTEIDGVVSTEAAAVASLYRDLDGYPQPLRGRLEELLREYTRLVIQKEWPAHKKGEALRGRRRATGPDRGRGPEVRADRGAREDHPGRGATVDQYRPGAALTATPVGPHGPAEGALGGRPGGGPAEYLRDISVLVGQPDGPCHPRRPAGDFHRPAGFPDRGDGQPLPRPVQHIV